MFINHSSIITWRKKKKRAVLSLQLCYSQPSCTFPARPSIVQGRAEGVPIWLSGSVQMPPSSFQHLKQSNLPLANCSRRLSPGCHLLSIFPTFHIFFLKHRGQNRTSLMSGPRNNPRHWRTQRMFSISLSCADIYVEATAY